MLCDSMAWLKALRSREGYVQTASSACRLWTIILMGLLFVLDMKLMITEVLELRHQCRGVLKHALAAHDSVGWWKALRSVEGRCGEASSAFGFWLTIVLEHCLVVMDRKLAKQFLVSELHTAACGGSFRGHRTAWNGQSFTDRSLC